jgi:hypothetical protein
MTCLRKQFNKCSQGTCNICDFVYKMRELATLVGGVDQCCMVQHLFDSLRANIRNYLFFSRLNPKTSS